MDDPVKTKIRAGGLRYESKSAGTNFPGPFAGTMSCFLCGRHVPRSQLVSFKLAGTNHLRCREGC
ncbi:MAG TPA: hypothetical protein VIE63_11140 [Ramlibacter sp.]|jgi:hypothetical protein